MILTVQATEVTSCAGQGQTGGARVEMVEWLLLDRVDGQRTGLGVDLADKHTVVVSATATTARPSVGDTAVVWTELALHHTIV